MKRFLILNMIFMICLLGVSSSGVAAEVHLVAVIMEEGQSRYQDIHAVFVENSKGFCGDSCKIYVQTPHADIMSLRNSVRKAVALGADLVITYGSDASLAAKAESTKIPILFVDVYDPVQLELVSSKSQTGRNMTGIRGDAPVQALLKYFDEAVHPQKLSVLYDAKSLEDNLQKVALEYSGAKRGIEVIPLTVENPEDHVTPLNGIPEDSDGLYLTDSDYDESYLDHVLKFATSRQLPVLTLHAGAAEAGAFMVLETSVAEQGEKLAEMAGQIFSGVKIKDLPMYRPRQVAFIVNLKVAKEYGIKVPFQTLSVASRVVR